MFQHFLKFTIETNDIIKLLILMQIQLKTIERLKDRNRQDVHLSNVNHSQRQNTHQSSEQMVSFMGLFRFTQRKDVILMIFGTICASALGASYPMFSFLWGNMIDSLVIIDNNPSNLSVTPSTVINSNIIDGTRKILIQFIYLGIGAFIVGWGMFASWMIAGSRQAAQCRKQYLSKLMQQEIQWFDLSNQSQLASKFAADCASFQMAISQKISTLIMILATFIAGLILAFVKGWLMAFAILIVLPLVIFGWILMVRVTTSKNSIQQKAYFQASSKMEEAISSIKTVKQLNGEEYEKTIYDNMLKVAVESMKQFGRKKGFVLGISNFFLLLSFITSFWYGSECVQGTTICPPRLNGGSTYTAGTVLTVFYSLILPAFNLSQLIPSLQKIMEGRAAAFRIYSIIDRQPSIKSPPNSLVPQLFLGVFKFKRVTFAYPKDKTKYILNNFSCEINTVNSGLVGKSGCGKSTIFQLMMRFYDPDEGYISLDGNDLKILDLGWLRNQIGYVGQEPVLFATSIKQNLRMSRPQATDEEIIAALKQAEAYDFVTKFSNGLQTYVGSGGSQISGGQKQRLAISRALLKNPKILLLDEATSSLDRKNQMLIENTLNKIASSMRIITISHSIATILRCERIMVIEQGKLSEQGTYQQLKYFDAIQRQDKFINLREKQKQNNLVGNQQLQTIPEDKLPQNIIGQRSQELIQNEQQKESVLLRILSYGKQYKIEIFFGIIASITNGFTFPLFSIFFGKILANQLIFSIDPAESRNKINQYSLIQIGIIVGQIITVFFHHTILLTVGSKITQQIRSEVFLKILKMPIPWFQCEKNISGQLTTEIFTDFRNINTFASQILHSMIFIVSSLCVGVIMALFYQWRIALVSLALLPLLGLSGFIQISIALGFKEGNNKTSNASSQIVNQSINNIRTVLTLGDQIILQRYGKSLNVDSESMVQKSNFAGFFFGLSFMILFITIALIFYIASIFTQQNNLDIQDVFSTIFIVLFVGISIGNSINYIPDTSAAKSSANHIFSILDEEDQDQIQARQQSQLLKTPIKGRIIFQSVDFKYQSRTELALNDVSFQVKEGEKVNLVGPSGCGKSTILQLIIGFYQPLKGNIWIDGILLKDYDVHHLRSCFGIVSQQPILFNETIRYNIKYNHSAATEEEIVLAAKKSNYNPQDERPKQSTSQSHGKGFYRNVGIRGSHLSGGQKQRVAIARMILRKPHVLLMDEATSALDSKNEQIVQDSLNQLMMGKTTINVTHKVDTIKLQTAKQLKIQIDKIEQQKQLILLFSKGINMIDFGLKFNRHDLMHIPIQEQTYLMIDLKNNQLKLYF